MKKAKTFEEYILNELEAYKASVRKSTDLLRLSMSVLDSKTELLNLIRSKLEVRTLSDGTGVIGMTLFETLDKESFQIMETFMGEDPEKEEKA